LRSIEVEAVEQYSWGLEACPKENYNVLEAPR